MTNPALAKLTAGNDQAEARIREALLACPDEKWIRLHCRAAAVLERAEPGSLGATLAALACLKLHELIIAKLNGGL